MAWMFFEALKKVQNGKATIPTHIELTDKEGGKLIEAIKHLQILNTAIISGDEVHKIFGEHLDDLLIHVPQFGVRAWLYRTEDLDIVLWDEGNDWYSVLAIFFHSTSIYDWLKKPICQVKR